MTAVLSPPRSLLRASDPGNWEIRWTAGHEALADLALDWSHLDQSGGSPIEHYLWVNAAATAFVGNERLRIMSVWDGNRLAAVAPLVLQRHGGGLKARLVGVS